MKLKPIRNYTKIGLAVVSGFAVLACKSHSPDKLPNILIIYADDLGYGDVSCYNKFSKISTPNIDNLATEGIRFTDAHTSAAICGPSRYGLLTGRYAWRKPDGITNGFTFENLQVEDSRLTIASMLKNLGYSTAQIGKWGLRANYKNALKDSVRYNSDSLQKDSFDFPAKRLLGANLCGFDYSWTLEYLSPSKNTKYAFENGLPVDPELKEYDPHRWLPDGTQKAIDYLNVYAGNEKYTPFRIDCEKPFFLYWDPHVPHEPIAPNKEFIGKTQAGDYGDFVFELDHSIGKILETLEKNGLAKNTLVLFSSDNGPELFAYTRIQEYQHYSMGEWRGVKRDNWEGGTRVPFIVRWPGNIKPNTIENTPVCLIDIIATIAGIVGVKLQGNQGEDSFSILSLLLNDKSIKYERAPIVYHTVERKMAIRDGDWVFIDAPTGMCSEEPLWFRKERGVIQHLEQVELFNLKKDPQQLENLASKFPLKVEELKLKLQKIMQKGSRL